MKVIRFHDLPLTPASHEDPHNPGVYKKVLSTSSDLLPGKVQMVNWAIIPAGKSFRAHYHESLQELFVVIKGEVRVNVNHKEETLMEGDAALISPGEVHTMANERRDEAELLVVGIAVSEKGKTVVT